ncbi:hypothetical protein SERLA73DRAFT_74922 [Serpula lacrymans var. lacrymans S7.3]|uniref:Uncharacterized protein n=1 Tax=Serpula lacrymans var. lacrymans (strain S7.3) TaxID=936435 RepID=F8Q200_SERL3|nr:hypothetical protein SERLA73DRAFT_74922 [Serpula lacrymans var. lacrymans S7.3]
MPANHPGSSNNAGISTIYPSNSVLHAANPPPARSVPRPDQYPFEILWEFDDCKKDKDAGLTAQNPARPAIERATTIKATTRVAQNKLEQLPLPKCRSQKWSRNYYLSAYPAQWAAIIQEMDQQQPLLALCSNHWKAEHVLGQMLRSSKLVDEEQEQEREREQKLKNDVKQGRVSRKWQENNGQFSVPIQKSLPPPSFLSVSSNKGSKKYDVDFIEVSSSILDLKTIITRDFDSNSFGINLLDAVELSTDFSPGPPSSLMLEFIECIKRADPNSPEFDEDDHGVSWGHHQFTSGSMMSSSVLTSWTAIGNCETASVTTKIYSGAHRNTL